MSQQDQQRTQKLREIAQLTEPMMEQKEGLETIQAALNYTTRQAAASQSQAEMDRFKDAQQKVVQALLLDDEGTLQVSQLGMRDLVAARDEEMDRLQREASRSGADKITHDRLGKKKRAAKKRLEEINRMRQLVQEIRDQRADPNLAGELAQQRSISRGRRWHNPLRAVMNSSALGSHADRHGYADGGDKTQFETINSASLSAVAITTASGTLKGALYSPTTAAPTGKLVIFFSGSHGPNASMITPVARAYTEAGASVLGVDYRGFGKSESQKVKGTTRTKQGTHLCEASLYEDGRAIYQYAITTMGYKPCDVILHGFSLGGSVASKVAADVAEENARQQQVSDDQRLGGLVLHSSIDSMYSAGKSMTGNFAPAGTVAWAGAGGYNTTSHMRRLHRFDPKLPVHYRGGGEEDQLSLEVTKLHLDPQAQFANASVFRGTEAHQGALGTRYRWDAAANVSSDTSDISPMVRLAQQGRAADLRG